MMNYQKYIEALRKCAKEHECDRTPTAHIIVSYLCRDTADLLEALEKESCEDAVSREEVLLQLTGVNLSTKSTDELIALFNKRIKSLPSVTPTQETGKWENKNVSCHYFYGKCSKCGQEFCVDTWYTQNMKYCPNCGARMENNE